MQLPTRPLRTVDLGGDTEITIRALAEKIVELTGSRSHINHVGVRFGDARSRHPNLSAATQELNWKPQTGLVEGLRRTIEYTERRWRPMQAPTGAGSRSTDNGGQSSRNSSSPRTKRPASLSGRSRSQPAKLGSEAIEQP